ncbi:MAG: class I SAM-dependent methyltransferase [Streptosporangiaceae bacterium]
MGNADHHHQSATRSHEAAEGTGAGPGHTKTGAGPDHAHAHAHAHGTGEAGETAMAELLDLDAEVLFSYLSEVTAWVHDLAAGGPHQRILDLGSGTGAGAVALAQRFEGAEVIAVDKSAYLLARLREKIRDLGVADRVRTVEADLDAAWPVFGPVDLAWASSSLHHMADPDRALGEIFATVRPGGLLVAAEIDSFPRFLADADHGSSGLEARCHDVMAGIRAEEVPHMGSDWGALLSKAGFTIEAERTFDIVLTPPLPTATGRYAQASLRRIRSGLDDRLSTADLAALDTLISGDGPDGVLRRDDLTVRAEKTVWAARRP